MKKQSKIAQIAIFFAIMLVLHLLSSSTCLSTVHKEGKHDSDYLSS